MKFQELYEFAFDRKAYMQKRNASKKALGSKNVSEEIPKAPESLEGPREGIFYKWDQPLPTKLTLDDLVGIRVSLKFRNGNQINGVVQKPREDFLDKDALRIFDLDNKEIRVIPKNWIIRGMAAGVGGKKEITLPIVNKGPKSWKVPGSKGNVYDVKREANGRWSCTCPAAKYQGGNCKHVRACKEKENES